MLIAVLKETTSQETRVALIPKHVAEFTSANITVRIEHLAGQKAGFSNQDYIKAGAEICATAEETCKDADIILKILAPSENELKLFKPHQTLICDTRNLNKQQLKIFSEARINLFALDAIPRISRAQNMDILSSQNNLSGYVAAILAATHANAAIPLLMTSAGTLPAMKTLVIGLGVAGLQAAATLHRLGAQVFAFDIRAETEAQARSVGAVWINKITPELLSATKIIITAAQTVGKPAPKLLNSQQLCRLPAYSVIVDLAADTGGNIDTSNHPPTVKLIADSHLARRIPYSASTLFSENLFNFCNLLIHDGELSPNFQDEIICATMMCCHKQSKNCFRHGE